MHQTELIAGDSLNFVTSTPAYPASAGWVLKYRLVPRTPGGNIIELAAIAEGDDHRVQVAASATAAWLPGPYGWSSWVEQGAERYTIDAGQLVVAPDPRTLAVGTDTRTLAPRTLDDLMNAKAGWDVSGGRKRRYVIAGREMEFNSEAEIIQKIHFWEAQVEREKTDAQLAQGLRPKNRILTRFVRPR